MNRIGVFVFYEESGKVGNYILYLLKNMKPFFASMICMSNVSLAKEEYEKLAPFFDKIIIRENKGYDVTAYKEGYFAIKDELGKYDEMLFFNGTVYGPVLPLDRLFGSMERQSVDFWGLSRHKESRLRVVEGTGLDYTPEHIQSYFFAVRKKMFLSPDFYNYWQSMKDILSYDDAVVNHELRFTKYFSERGFTWTVYLKKSWMEKFHEYVMISHPVECVAEYSCPFVKRRAVMNSFIPRVIPYGQSRENDIIKYLREKTDYPVEYIIEDLCCRERVVNIENALSRNIILGNQTLDPKEVLTVIFLDASYDVSFCRDLIKERKNIMIFFQGTDTKTLKERIGSDGVRCINAERDLTNVMISELSKRQEKYLFFTSNLAFEGCKYNLLDDAYRAGVEEAYKSLTFLRELGEAEHYMEEHNEICAIVGHSSWWNALNACREEKTVNSYDRSSQLIANYTFLSRRDCVLEALASIDSLTARDLCFIPTIVFKHTMKEVAIAYNREEADSSLRYVLSLQKQSIKNAKTIERYDHARAFAEDFLRDKGIKERLWFLWLAVSPSKRKKVRAQIEEFLRK